MRTAEVVTKRCRFTAEFKARMAMEMLFVKDRTPTLKNAPISG